MKSTSITNIFTLYYRYHLSLYLTVATRKADIDTVTCSEWRNHCWHNQGILQVGIFCPNYRIIVYFLCLLEVSYCVSVAERFPYLWWWSIVSAFGSSAASTRHEWWYFLFQCSNYKNHKMTVRVSSKCLKFNFVLCRLQRCTYQRNFANRGCSDESWIGLSWCWNFHWYRKIYQAEQYNAKGQWFSVSKSVFKIWIERP